MRTTGKRPTREQRDFIDKCKHDPFAFLVVKDTRHENGEMMIIHKKTKETFVISKI